MRKIGGWRQRSSTHTPYESGYKDGVDAAENKLGPAPASKRKSHAEALRKKIAELESQRKKRLGPFVHHDYEAGWIDGHRSVLRKYGVEVAPRAPWIDSSGIHAPTVKELDDRMRKHEKEGG